MMARVTFGIGLAVILMSMYSCRRDTSSTDYCVFHYNQINPISSLDPAFAKSQNNIWAVNHIFDGLLQLDDQLNIQPCIAKDWFISEGGRVYTFYLRDDIYFHEDASFGQSGTRQLVANDVKYSFERIISDKVNSPGSWIFSDLIAGKDSFIAIDDFTFQVRLEKAFLPFLGLLTMEYCSIVPREAVSYYGSSFRENPVGTGPFIFKRWLQNQGLFLLTNQKYFAGANTQLDGIRTSFITDRNIAYLELLRGNIDFMTGVESSIINQLLDENGELRSDKKDKIKLYKSPYLNTEYLGINMDLSSNTILANKSFRQALNYAIDKSQMIATLRNNIGIAATSGIIPVGLPSFDPEAVRGYTYNPDKARMLLEKSGYFDKDRPEVIEIYTNKDYLDLTTYVAKQWERVGVNVELKLMESAVLRDAMRKSKITLFRASWIADYPDVENYLSLFYSRNGAPPNYTRFKNITYDRLYDKALGETNDSLRFALYQQMDRIIVDEAPVIFLFYDVTTKFVSKRISGISHNALNKLETNAILKECGKAK